MTYWFNGQLHSGTQLSLAIQDPALFYGATVFTTLRIYNNHLDHPLTAWAAHQKRLINGLRAFSWPEPNWDRVCRGAEILLHDYPLLRVTCFLDGRELVTGRHFPLDLWDMQAEGVTTWIAEGELYQRPLPAYKTGNYLGAWLALQAAQQHGAREAILVDARGQWLETSTGNLWGWANGQWHTPGLESGLLPGIVRSHLIEHLRQRGERVKQSAWPPGVIQRFEVLAYSNSAVQVVPIHTVIGDRSRLELNPQHPALEALRAAFREN
ncbi:aminotransferase class IV [Nodosilinea sp. LEGE 07298]|uniref:aminotransferase class IV n=1 Tax=Nodosilinea sp. LEGE 07298 TaxID=2777970 RepID=UPI00187F07C1|nr:aminotransferase class IV [Nodosilinea sp. LEGE 07298]MBE9113757.1 aminotransferase class IV [Nodosilinea sp. LEGE 07298]